VTAGWWNTDLAAMRAAGHPPPAVAPQTYAQGAVGEYGWGEHGGQAPGYAYPVQPPPPTGQPPPPTGQPPPPTGQPPPPPPMGVNQAAQWSDSQPQQYNLVDFGEYPSADPSVAPNHMQAQAQWAQVRHNAVFGRSLSVGLSCVKLTRGAWWGGRQFDSIRRACPGCRGWRWETTDSRERTP
jgi:hypothetical protein